MTGHEEKSKLPEVTALLTIGGDVLDFDECSARLGLQPTRVWRQKRADLAGMEGLNTMEWSVGLEKRPTVDLDDALENLMDLLWPVRENLREFVSEKQLRASFDVSITIWMDRPLLRIGSQTFQRLAFFGYELTLDIIDYSADDDDHADQS